MLKVKCKKCQKEFLWEGNKDKISSCIFCHNQNVSIKIVEDFLLDEKETNEETTENT